MRELRATYRLQLSPGFDLARAGELADYLADLGVSHVYTSPLLQAVRGSTHGYDVVDPRRVSTELGGGRAFERFRATFERHDLGIVVDIVPNHMAIDSDNAWWWDVLENGAASRFASYFDVDWDAPEARLRDRVLVPVLADHYGRVLQAGGLRLERERGCFLVRYHDHAFPVAPRSQDGLLQVAASRSGSEELAFIADAFGRLPLATSTDHASISLRHRDKEVLRRALERLLAASPAIAQSVDRVVAEWNADPDALDGLLERQNWRLARWRTGERDVAYRRFFDVHSLVGIRVEDPRVFAETHALVLEWIESGAVDGLRIDHVDGLRDPARYLRRLREAAPHAWIVVEKILERDEPLPDAWPVDGTTGYDFLNLALGLFVDPTAEKPLAELHAWLTGETADWEATVREKKRLALHGGLAADLGRLAALALAICERHREWRDYTRHELHEALCEAIACFPVYRTYVTDAEPPGARDAGTIRAALAVAREQRPDVEPELFRFLESLLLRELAGPLETEFALRFQQLAAPAHAKGAEDTALYTFTRLAAVNEVGGSPGELGVSPIRFHAGCEEILERWPRTLLATATHDTKRGEDVRARLALLSEIPERWADAVRRLRACSLVHRRESLPDGGMEHLFYQTLVGAWPIERERVLAYLEKAAREAKTHTSWTHPDAHYEDALRGFADGALSDPTFTGELERFVAPLVLPGRVNSLAQTLLKLTAPGVPDLYQGCELWDTSLVDPDNRRPVDFALRRRLLAELEALLAAEVWRRHESGLPKLHVIRAALALRRRRPRLFGPEAAYEPLVAEGAVARHAVAFVRGGGALTVIPRLVLGLAGDWGDTALALPDGDWQNVLAPGPAHRGCVALAALLADFPVALLEREG